MVNVLQSHFTVDLIKRKDAGHSIESVKNVLSSYLMFRLSWNHSRKINFISILKSRYIALFLNGGGRHPAEKTPHQTNKNIIWLIQSIRIGDE